MNDNNKNYIITRVINSGDMEDLRKLFNYYGWDAIEEIFNFAKKI